MIKIKINILQNKYSINKYYFYLRKKILKKELYREEKKFN